MLRASVVARAVVQANAMLHALVPAAGREIGVQATCGPLRILHFGHAIQIPPLVAADIFAALADSN